MTKFHFHLDGVLQYRRQQAAMEETKLAGLQAEMQRWENAFERIRGERIDNKERLLQEKEIYAMTLGAVDSYSDFLQTREQFAIRQIRECRTKVQQQRLKVLEAQRQTKLLELLKDKAKVAWQQDVAREEEAVAADAHLAARFRASRGQGSEDADLN